VALQADDKGNDVASYKNFHIRSLLFICFILLLSLSLFPEIILAKAVVGNPSNVVLYKNNLLTIRVNNVSLRQVLEDIGYQTGIEIVINVSEETPVSADFSGISVEKGLKRLIRNFNHIFIYDSNEATKGESKVRTVILYNENMKFQEGSADYSYRVATDTTLTDRSMVPLNLEPGREVETDQPEDAASTGGPPGAEDVPMAKPFSDEDILMARPPGTEDDIDEGPPAF